MMEVVRYSVINGSSLVSTPDSREGIPGRERASALPSRGSVRAAHDDGEGALGPLPEVQRGPSRERRPHVELEGRRHGAVVVAVDIGVGADSGPLLHGRGDLGDGGGILTAPWRPAAVRNSGGTPIAPSHLADWIAEVIKRARNRRLRQADTTPSAL